MQSALQYHFEAADFLAWEAVQTEKHEYLAGDVFAMVGARREHVVVQLKHCHGIETALRGSPCQRLYRLYEAARQIRGLVCLFFIPMSWSPATRMIVKLSSFYHIRA